MVEHKLLSLFVAGIIGLVIANLVSSVRINLFDYYLNKIFKTSNNNLINLFTTFVQSIIIIIFLYFIYNNFVVYFDTKYSVDKFNKFDEITWRNNILNEIRDIKKLM
jgi:flagellar biosynthesis protein FlhB